MVLAEYIPSPGELVYEPRGQIIDLFRWIRSGKCPHGEIVELLVEGAAGTGKSRAIGEFLYQCMEAYPGCRILVVRKTRKALSESWMVTWEDKVLWPGHPMLEGAGRNNRHAYYHQNGSSLVLGGMDEPGNLYSTEWDVVVYEEAFQSVLDEWVQFFRSLRNFKMPFQLLIGVTNPERKRHYLNQRAMPGGATVRVKTYHSDNPSLRKSYLEQLAKTPGVRGRRLFLGEWCEAEGLIFPEFDPARHLMFLKDMPYHKALLGEKPGKVTRIKGFYGGMDWGYDGAGVFTVWGADDLNRLYMVAEVYKTKHGIPYWADMAVKLDKRFHFDAIFCDPSQPAMIDLFNTSIGSWRGRDGQSVAVKGKNAWLAGIEALRERLIGQNNEPTIFFGHDSMVDGRDERLAEANKPFCLTMEIDEYTYHTPKEGQQDNQRQTDAEDKSRAAHSIDTARMVCLSLVGYDEREGPKTPKYAPGTYGSVDGSDELFGDDNPYRESA